MDGIQCGPLCKINGIQINSISARSTQSLTWVSRICPSHPTVLKIYLSLPRHWNISPFAVVLSPPTQTAVLRCRQISTATYIMYMYTLPNGCAIILCHHRLMLSRTNNCSSMATSSLLLIAGFVNLFLCWYEKNSTFFYPTYESLLLKAVQCLAIWTKRYLVV